VSSRMERTDYNFLLKKQVSIIKDAVSILLKNAKRGDYHNFLFEVQRIEQAASSMSSQMGGGLPTFTKYRRILVPYDGSTHSKKALLEAIDIAREFGAELYVINIIDISTDVPSAVLHSTISKKLKKLSREILGSQQAKVNAVLQEKVKMCKRDGVKVSCDVMIGKPANSILKFAKERRIELVVIGSRGLTRLRKLMALGSVSRKVSEESKCPVLIVR
jgi:nucleotide-binding universal stress UspA family protein